MTIYNVATTTELETALAACTFGDTIKLAHGASFALEEGGSFHFPDKGVGTSYITVTTDNPSGIPSQLSTDYPYSYAGGTFTRLNSTISADMPKMVQWQSTPVILLEAFSHHWKFVGLEITNLFHGLQVTDLINDASTTLDSVPHHIIFDQCYMHPEEEVGDLSTTIQYRSVESCFEFSVTDSEIMNCCVQGFTGHSRAEFELGVPLDDITRLNANSLLFGTGIRVNVHNNLLESNGQVFFGGGGDFDPAHTGTATSITFTSATFSQTTDLEVGDIFAIYDRQLSENHTAPNAYNPEAIISQEGHYVNGKVLTVNHTTGEVTFTTLTSGLNYRRVNLNLYGATGGTYTLTFQGQTTVPIAWNADADTILLALTNLSNLADDEVSVTPGIYGDWLIRFGGVDNLPPSSWSYPTLLDYDPTYGSPIIANDIDLVDGVVPPTATIHTAESFSPLEHKVGDANYDVPDEGAIVTWKGLQSNNCTFERNIIAHHPEWTAVTGSVKGFGEIKGGEHITFNGNIFSGEGTGLIWTVRNQGDGGSSPWSNVNYSLITNNLWDRNGEADGPILSDGAHECEVSHDHVISNNIFLRPEWENPVHPWAQVQNGAGVIITHNTIFCVVEFIRTPAFAASENMVIRDNIIRPAGVAMSCTDGTVCWPAITGDHNLIINNRGVNPDYIDTFFTVVGEGAGWLETDLANVRFVDVSPHLDELGQTNFDIFGDYSLDPTSRYATGGDRQASDGTDVGVDMPALIAAMGFNPFTGEPSANPSVNAGTDQSLSIGTTSTTLVATADDPNSSALTYLWTRTSGPNTPTIVSPTALTTSITGMIAGTYVFKMTATNAEALTGEDSVQVAIASSDVINPTISITSPTEGAVVSGTISVTANAADNVGVAGVQFKLDGANLGAEDTTSAYLVSWNTTGASNGAHTLSAVARDAAGNTATATTINVTVDNGGGVTAAFSITGHITITGKISIS